MADILTALGVEASPDHVVSPADLTGFSTASSAIADKMTTLVKGVGYAVTDKPTDFGQGGNAPLTNPDQIFTRAMRAEKAWKTSISTSLKNPDMVVKSLSPAFRDQFGAFLAQTPQSMMLNQVVSNLQQQVSQAIGKNFTLSSPLTSGFVPFNLVAPSRLIYPVYSPFRNKVPRTQGQGLSYRQKVITGISGSQTGASGGQFVDIAIPELTGGGSMSNWPLNLPASGNQNAVDINVPYRFMGLTESVSWLQQFAGQGFEDVSALANLILLQEFMLSEEAQMMVGTATALTAPGAPTLTVRNANSGETALSGTITNNTVNVKVTAANFFGETAAGSATAATSVTSGTSVVDVQISPVPGALWYNLYVAVGTVPGTYYLAFSSVGGKNFTLTGAVPTSGTAAPTSDSGTSSAYRPEGIIPTLAGHSQGSSGQVYPTGWQGGYINQSVGDTLKISVLSTALQQLWSGTGAYRADPAELVGEGSDIKRLSEDIISAGASTNYRLHIEQSETPGVRAGAAVAEIVNPVTRSIVRIVVHPWLTQGTAMLMTYQLPFSWSNVANAWEYNLVQDYLSIAWPVIDATFRFSMFTYGAMAANAPQYSGILQGLQKTDRSGSSGTWT